jgi:hypothetical protein
MRQHRLVRLVHSLLLIGACAAIANPASAQTPPDITVANTGGRVPSPTPPLRTACVADRSPALDNPTEVRFNINTELQGIYDEISQVEIPFGGDTQDLYSTVLFAPDWTFVDLAGKRQSWAEKRALDLSEWVATPWDSRIQRIHSLTILPAGASTVVYVTTRRTIVDTEGRYGPKGVCRTLREEAVYSDKWVKVSDKWKMASREQARPSKVALDKRW